MRKQRSHAPNRTSRRVFLQQLTAALSAAPWIARGEAAAEKEEPSETELLREADRRILKHRRGLVSVRILGRDGRPLAFAPARWTQTQHKFLFGCNLFRFGRIPDPEREARYRSRFADLWNYATLGFYWPYFEPVQGRPRYAYIDQAVAWCREQGVTPKGHPLMWDYADPSWLPRDFKRIQALAQARVRKIVSRYKGRIDIWDVVNEPTHLGRFGTRLGEWALSLGAVPYVVMHLKAAREANPQALLLVNDYRTDAKYYRILELVRATNQALFDVIGIQSHMHGGTWPLARVWKVCDMFSRLGLPLHFTETTVPSGKRLPRSSGRGSAWEGTTLEGEAAQAAYTEKFYRMLFGHPAVEAITWWDFSDDGAWMGAPAGILRRDMSPKPVFHALRNLIKGRWWTAASGQTDKDGRWQVSAFHGTHRLSVRLPDGREATRIVETGPEGPREIVWRVV